ncbi:MAG: PEP/pyruvate-binding domain-containing protein [Desulfobacteraceae bacterium]
MKTLLDMDDCLAAGQDQVGGKAHCLAKIHEAGILVPRTFCVPCRVYEDFLEQTHLKDRIFLAIHQKPLEKMRWEEIWDISLRIRSFFLTTPVPQSLQKNLETEIRTCCGAVQMAVRSSAPGEDSSESSFAGLHDSFLNVSGGLEIIKHIKLVWASLYSDAALLYRKELGIDINTSRMAVILQELIPSDKAGIFFGLNPSDSGESVIEAVYGLNQALVDGDIEPDRWLLNRSTGKILDHTQPARQRRAIPVSTGIAFAEVHENLAQIPPLDNNEVNEIWETGKKLETLFGKPQDVEWTFVSHRLIILQSRPITSTGFNETDDKRAWYLTLHRSYDNLKALHEKINHDLIPRMISDAERLGRKNLKALSAKALRQEIEERQNIYDHWVKVYWRDFIPFAHGIRLFGQLYNDAVTPEDPYEFMTLLENTGLKSMERNHHLETLAGMIRSDTRLKTQLEDDIMPDPDHPFTRLLDSFINQFGDLSCSTGTASECQYGPKALIRVLLEFSNRPPRPVKTSSRDTAAQKKKYFDSFSPERRDFAEDILNLARESYRLRDDDNIHLGRIEARLYEAVEEGRQRLSNPLTPQEDIDLLTRISALSAIPEEQGKPAQAVTDQTVKDRWVKSRQIVGHPAGPGIATGKARRIQHPQDLMSFRQGEILVCQGVDPNMTFIVPLAAAVVEERGGMLIHGAIIAREYGLPCITGASNAMQLIENNSQITVDGYLGIITCQTDRL